VVPITEDVPSWSKDEMQCRADHSAAENARLTMLIDEQLAKLTNDTQECN